MAKAEAKAKSKKTDEEVINLNELKKMKPQQLAKYAAKLDIEGLAGMRKQELMFAILQAQTEKGGKVYSEGVLETLPDGFGFVRILSHSLAATAADAHVSQSQVRSLNLQSGHRIRGPVRAPRSSERFFALSHVDSIQGVTPEERQRVAIFEARTPIVAQRELRWCADDQDDPLLRPLQALAPIRFGHRVLLHESLTSPCYADLRGVAVALPHAHTDAQIPSPAALAAHRLWCGF